MDQVGYPGVDEDTFRLVAEGKTPPPDEGEAAPGITTDSLAATTTAGFGKMEREGPVRGGKR